MKTTEVAPDASVIEATSNVKVSDVASDLVDAEDVSNRRLLMLCLMRGVVEATSNVMVSDVTSDLADAEDVSIVNTY
ncbi:MAG: hypothetical protein GX939_08850 [Clostridiaceae bacterium]|nr:hypothetical protein [Clostridiaceae bacterium]